MCTKELFCCWCLECATGVSSVESVDSTLQNFCIHVDFCLVPLPLIMSGVLKLPLLFLNYVFLPSILLFLSRIFRGSVVESVSSVQFSRSVVSDSLRPHGLQHARPPCPSPIPRVYSNSCPLSWLCHSTISSSFLPLSRLQSFPTSGSFQMSQPFTSGGQNIGVLASTSVLQ